MNDDNELAPMLKRRRIEAEILGHVYAALKEAQGAAVAANIVAEAVRRSAIAQGQAMAQAQGAAAGLKGFVDLQPMWTRGGALETTTRESGEKSFGFDVTRCRYQEMYRQMGLGDIGHLLSCQRDAAFCEGYDPKLKLTRTQTLAEGASHCDFRYRYEE